MKRIIMILISALIPLVVCGQVETKKQKGIVRTQSFVNKKSSPIVGARITRSGDNVNPVLSLETPEKGYFELSLDDLNGSDVYYIKSVKAPNGLKYQLMYPQPNERLQYTPDAPLTIIMQSYDEIDEYAEGYKDRALKELKEKNDKEIAQLEEKCNQGIITIIEKDRQIEELNDKLLDFQGLIRSHIHTTLQNTDFESLDSLHREIYRALETGDYEYHAALLNRRTDYERRLAYDKAKNEAEATQILADAKKEVFEKTRKKILYEKDHLVQNALHKLEFNEVLLQMKDRLYYDSLNVNYLCQIGELLEIRFNDYKQALTYYHRALSSANQNSATDASTIALCHNHLGDVYLNLSDYSSAEGHYINALSVLSHDATHFSEIYDSYLGLGNVSFAMADFSVARSYYNKCVDPKVSTLNSKAYWQARIGITQIKSLRGDYRGAKSELEKILLELEAQSEVDPVTISMAYISMIECLVTMGQIYEAIDFCNETKQRIQQLTTPKNSYIANVLSLQGKAYLNIGKINDGVQCMNEAINIYSDILGEHHPNYASACLSFADYYLLIGDLKKSEEMTNKAFDLIVEKFGDEHLALVGVHFSKFQLYDTLSDHDRAIAELETIKNLYRLSGIYGDYQKIQVFNSEAKINMFQGEYLKAIKNLNNAIDCVIKTQGKDASQLIELYDNLAYAYLEINENDNAKIYIDKQQTLANKVYGADSQVAIVRHMSLGKYYLNKGEFRKSIEVYTTIEKVLEDTFGADSYQLTNIYDLLGDYYLTQYQFEKSKKYFDKTYEIIKNTFGESHYFIANSIANLGTYYASAENFFSGLEMHQQAYDILSNQFDARHKSTVASRTAICSAYIALGRYDEAESMLADLTKDVERFFGNECRLYTDVLSLQATLYQHKGDSNKAIDCVEDAIKILEAQFGKNHSLTLAFYNNLSNLYAEIADFDKAIKYNDTAISIAIDFYGGKDHPGVMLFLMSRGNIYASLNKYAESHKIYDKVKTVLIDNFGEAANMLYNVRIEEARLLLREGYYEQALNILDQLKSVSRSIFGDNTIGYVSLYLAYAETYQGLMQYEKARHYYTISLDILQGVYGENSIMCLNALLGLGNLCISEDSYGVQFDEAYNYFHRAYSISVSAYGTNNLMTLYFDTLLGNLYLRVGELQEAYNRFIKFNVALKQTLGESNKANFRLAESYMSIGNYYHTKATITTDLEAKRNIYRAKALEHYSMAKEILEEINGFDTFGATHAIAQTYFAMQQPDLAISTQKEYAELLIKKYGKHSPNVAKAYAALGEACVYESNVEKEKLVTARDSYLKAISIMEKIPGNTKENLLSFTLNWKFCLAKIYAQLNESDKAYEIVDRVIDEFETLSLDSNWGLYTAYSQKANMLAELENKYDEALQYKFKAEKIFPTLKFSNELAKIINQSILQLELTYIYNMAGRKEDALKSCDKAYKILRSYNHKAIEYIKIQIKMLKEQLEDNLN